VPLLVEFENWLAFRELLDEVQRLHRDLLRPIPFVSSADERLAGGGGIDSASQST